LFAYSDENGKYKIENIGKTDGWLYVNRKGYRSDSVKIEWNENKTSKADFFINRNPQLDSIIFSSIVVNKYPDVKMYSFFVAAKVMDDENDIDSVFITNENFAVKEKLDYNLSTGFFEGVFKLSDFNISNVDQIIGKYFDLFVLDKNGFSFNVGEENIKRIIKDNIKFISPASEETVSSPFDLRWERYSPGFDFTYEIKVFTQEISPEVIWEKRDLPKETIFYKITDEIPSGDYFWVIYCIDEFHNRGSSKPATFSIE